jgi:hypothetical protein
MQLYAISNRVEYPKRQTKREVFTVPNIRLLHYTVTDLLTLNFPEEMDK